MRKLLKIIGLSLVLSLSLVTALARPAAAHVLKENNGVSAVLHIPPEDNPKAGDMTALDLSFGDEQNTFNLQHCVCQVVVKNNGQNVQAEPLKPVLAGATLDGMAAVKFPSAGVYDVIVQGKAQNATFRQFSLDYLVRVAASSSQGSAASSSKGSQVLIISSGSLIILIMIAYTLIQFGDRYKPKPRRQK